MIDKHPALIARCTGVTDVISAVCDNGIVIDLPRMKGMRVDPIKRTATAQAGLLWGDFNHETQPFGLATPGGIVSTTGIAGLTLSDAAIDAIITHAWSTRSPLSYTVLSHLGGALSRIDKDETAFGDRDGLCSININAVWSDPLESDEHIRWTREFFASTEPFSTGGVYVNFLGNEGEKRVRAAYGEVKYKRLTALKNKYDPTNFFSLNQNIKPGK